MVHRVDSEDVHRPTRPALPLCKRRLHCRKLRRRRMAALPVLLPNSWHPNQERASTNNDRVGFSQGGQAGTSASAATARPPFTWPRWTKRHSAVIRKQLDRVVEAAHRVFADPFEIEIAFDEI